jgi:transposase
MRPTGSGEQLEKRRRRAVELLAEGQTFRGVAQRLGASLSSVVRWWQSYRRKGARGLDSRPTPGRPCRLSRSQKRRLEKLLLDGARSAGYATELWTLRRIGDLMRKQFGVHYSISGVRRLLVVDLAWSTQKPERRATERDEAAIAEWKRSEWPRLKKNETPRRVSRVPR